MKVKPTVVIIMFVKNNVCIFATYVSSVWKCSLSEKQTDIWFQFIICNWVTDLDIWFYIEIYIYKQYWKYLIELSLFFILLLESGDITLSGMVCHTILKQI